MTQTPDTEFPTEWHTVDAISEIDARHISIHTVELRSPTATMIISTEGFEYFRDHDRDKWKKYLKENGIESIPRNDIRGKES